MFEDVMTAGNLLESSIVKFSTRVYEYFSQTGSDKLPADNWMGSEQLDEDGKIEENTIVIKSSCVIYFIGITLVCDAQNHAEMILEKRVISLKRMKIAEISLKRSYISLMIVTFRRNFHFSALNT